MLGSSLAPREGVVSRLGTDLSASCQDREDLFQSPGLADDMQTLTSQA